MISFGASIASLPDFDGVHVSVAAEALGKPYRATCVYLYHRGYRVLPGGVFSRIRSADDVEQEISERIANAAPSSPCWRCGARKGCGHR